MYASVQVSAENNIDTCPSHSRTVRSLPSLPATALTAIPPHSQGQPSIVLSTVVTAIPPHPQGQPGVVFVKCLVTNSTPLPWTKKNCFVHCGFFNSLANIHIRYSSVIRLPMIAPDRAMTSQRTFSRLPKQIRQTSMRV